MGQGEGMLFYLTFNGGMELNVFLSSLISRMELF